MPEISVRPAVEEDLPAILRLYAEAGLDEGIRLPLPDAQALFRRIEAHGASQFYVTEANGEVIGTFALTVVETLGHGGSRCGFVEDVAVDGAWRGLGVGRRMMDFARDRCREIDCFKLTLSSHLSRHQAHGFYESLGYRKHGYSFFLDIGAEDRD